jgi:RNA ligase (TIGR02306 family)
MKMKLASIETVAAVEPHNNADRLEVAKVLGWQTVVKKGEFKPGDRAVFVVIDTILPRAPWSEFLVDVNRPDRRIRLKTAKIRGRFSQGLLLPITVLPEGIRTWQDGCDVGGELGIKKYEKDLPLALSGVARSNFPTHLAPKTDEDNGLSNPDIVAMVLKHPVYVTQKLDGSSCTVIVEGGKISHVCSRNLSLVDQPGNAFWHAARKLTNIEALPDCVIQGELMGPGIQGNQLGLKEPTLYVFSMMRASDHQPMEYDCMANVARGISAEVVPWIGRYGGMLQTSDHCQELADMQKLPDGKPAEGIVIRIDPPQSFGNGRPAGFKIINRNYVDTD